MKFEMSLCMVAVMFAQSALAVAEAPEQLDQLEPGHGEWQAEYYGTFGSTTDAERGHTVELYHGIAPGWAIGTEVEAEVEDGELSFDEVGLAVLATLRNDDDRGPGLGVMVSAGFDRQIDLSEVEARFIIEQESDAWWLQGNVMLRRQFEPGHRGTMLAYGWSLQRSVADDVWLGLEGSGQAASLSGFSGGAERGQFLGPSLTAEIETGKNSEIELGIAAFRRVSGDGPRHSLRLFVQAGF